ncbi:hypothetical protein D3C76_798450 [compost metagenome]
MPAIGRVAAANRVMPLFKPVYAIQPITPGMQYLRPLRARSQASQLLQDKHRTLRTKFFQQGQPLRQDGGLVDIEGIGQ